MDEYFRAQQNPRGDPQAGGAFVTPPRNGSGPLLPRRFTTDSGRVPTLSTLTTVPRVAPEPPQDFASTSVCVFVRLLNPWQLESDEGTRQRTLGVLVLLLGNNL